MLVKKNNNNNNKIKRSGKFTIKEIIRSSKNQLSSCYMTLGNFNLPPAISGTHLGEWCDFVVNTVAMTFQIPGKKTWPILLSLENGIVLWLKLLLSARTFQIPPKKAVAKLVVFSIEN